MAAGREILQRRLAQLQEQPDRDSQAQVRLIEYTFLADPGGDVITHLVACRERVSSERSKRLYTALIDFVRAEARSHTAARAERLRIEEALRSYPPLAFSPNRDAEGWLLPGMTTIYRELSDAQDGLPPFQDDFARAVADQAAQWLDRDAVVARAKGKYPSFVRQQHFGLLLREHFADVRSDDQLDFDGVDFLITEDGREYIILLTKDRGTAQLDRKLPKLQRAASPWRDTPYRIIDQPTLPVGPRPYYLLHQVADVEEVRLFIRACQGGSATKVVRRAENPPLP